MLESLNVEELDPRDYADRVTPVEELEAVVLDDELTNRAIYIGSLVNSRLRKELIQFLKKNQDVFVWYHKDMLGINPRITSHRPKCEPRLLFSQTKKESNGTRKIESIQQ